MEGVARIAARPGATIFMMHRFADADRGNIGDDPAALRSILAMLRRQRIELLPLSELIRRMAHHQSLDRPAVVITIDDGYRDFATVGAPIFAEFDCPVTVFVTTEIVTRREWFWWDRIEAALLRSPRPSATLSLGEKSWHIRLGDSEARRRDAESIAEACKCVRDSERRAFTDGIGAALDVELPATPDSLYEVMDWDEIRQLERSGVGFGPHSRTHPILSQVDDTSAHDEILGSWSSIQLHCENPVPVFCFPNGTAASFTARDVALVRQAGMLGAVTYLRSRVPARDFSPDACFSLPRVEWSPDLQRATLVASGLLPLD
jgi:peptidoglycan/xylan/chitin deacetylase (PgdA/CDA1 family)